MILTIIFLYLNLFGKALTCCPSCLIKLLLYGTKISIKLGYVLYQDASLHVFGFS